jgi:AcrR family transcriptional regulator
LTRQHRFSRKRVLAEPPSRDVARAAGIADGTIYNYFENKTALMLGILDRLNQTDRREQDFAEAGEVDVQEWGQRYIKQRFEELSTEGFQVFQVLIAEVLVNEELRERYFQQIIGPTFAIAEGYFKQWVERGHSFKRMIQYWQHGLYRACFWA